MSFGCRSGKSARRVCSVSPAASMSSTSLTRMRKPRIHGRPPHWFGLKVMRCIWLMPARYAARSACLSVSNRPGTHWRRCLTLTKPRRSSSPAPASGPSPCQAHANLSRAPDRSLTSVRRVAGVIRRPRPSRCSPVSITSAVVCVPSPRAYRIPARPASRHPVGRLRTTDYRRPTTDGSRRP